MLVRGEVATGRFHLQLTASTSRGGSDDLLFKMIPDIEELAAHTTALDPDWIPVTLRGIGEMTGDRTSPVPDLSRSWIDLSPFETDEYGVPRAYVHLVAAPSDIATWAAMDAAALQLAQTVAGQPDRIQYFWDGQWRTQPFPINRPFPDWHRGLGTTYHESGTLWMGDDPATSVTDTVGRFHHVSNAYACDQSHPADRRLREPSPDRSHPHEAGGRGLADLNAGVWTYTLDKGHWSSKQDPADGHTFATSCEGWYTVRNDGAAFTTMTTVEGGDCAPPTWSARWSFRKDKLTWSDVSIPDFGIGFAGDWQKIG